MTRVLEIEIQQMGDNLRRQKGFSGSWASKYPKDRFFLIDPSLVKGFLLDPIASPF